MHIYADPQDPDTVWVLNLQLLKSTDGGRTFSKIATPHGDNHDLWIDPRNPKRMIESNDGGACVTFNGGESWSSIHNQPTAEMYHVTVDNQVPYRVYGAQQDNTAISLPSLSTNGAITEADWFEPGGGESGHLAVRPDDPNVVYGGSYSGTITRHDRRTGQIQDIAVWPDNSAGWAAKELRYRFQWTFPIVVSTHDPNVLYATGNHVFRSTNEGMSWEVLSPDLTRNDVTKLEASGGPITKDNVSTEYYGTIFAFAESRQQPGVLWAGSDDGLVHSSRDGGRNWQNVTPPTSLLPDWATISTIEPSPHNPACAYLAAIRYKLDDFAPYLYKTADYGQTWTKIVEGIPAHEFTRVIREDPVRRGLLYAGTELGLRVSFDDGASWQSLQVNLPVCPIHDLAVKDADLVAATHGRSFWILDDISPLRQWDAQTAVEDVHLFEPRPTIRFRLNPAIWQSVPIEGQRLHRFVGPHRATYRYTLRPNGEVAETFLDAGKNPPAGVIVYYHLREHPEGDLTLTFLDVQGREIRRFSSREAPEDSTDGASEVSGASEPEKPRLRATKERGLNRFVWDMRYPEATRLPGAVFWGTGPEGPMASPGTYQLRLTVGDRTETVCFEIHKDPRIPATQADLDAQFALLTEIRDKLSQTHEAIKQIRDLRAQIEGWERRVQERDRATELSEAAKALRDRLRAIEGELIQVQAEAFEDTLNFPIQLNNKLTMLASTVASADTAPTKQSREVYESLAAQVDAQIARLREVGERDVAAFNALLQNAAVPALALM